MPRGLVFSPVRVSVTVVAEVPETVTDEGNLHPTRMLETTPPASEQERFTVPVNPLNGVIAIVEVLPLVAPGAKVMLVLLLVRANDGVAVTVSPSVLVAEMLGVTASVAVITTE